MAIVTIEIPDEHWRAFAHAPKDGSLLLVRNAPGDADLWQWDDGEWNAEFGCVSSDPTMFVSLLTATPPDHAGRCGRCGRVRSGP